MRQLWRRYGCRVASALLAVWFTAGCASLRRHAGSDPQPLPASALRAAVLGVVLGGVIGAGASAMLALRCRSRFLGPLQAMRPAIERLTRGDLAARVGAPREHELRWLADALNTMAEQLRERTTTLLRQRDEQQAILASMVEGVLAVDRNGLIMNLNSAAAHLLHISPDGAVGRSVEELVRNADLQKFIAATLTADTPAEAEIVFRDEQERVLQLHGTALRDGHDQRLGALVVLRDITRLKRLETMRRDFIANLSHELKTPVTALKGCVETLRQLHDAASVDERRFLEMMGRQVDRLEALVEDLLTLSRIEHEEEQQSLARTRQPLRPILERAAQTLAPAAERKGISVKVACAEDLAAPINAPLLEQAVGNLLDNAIKYSGAGTTVTLSAVSHEQAVEIRVTDQGPGIERRHLPRIFERFYRADEGRSRTQGGTGLGLAIVKHIAQAHGGTVAVTSTVGQGSTFCIRIPAG